ncbi:MAG: response regulator [Nitrosarchaeum sp.]|nr:response regulator [Nitrosarchaeum sp.]
MSNLALKILIVEDSKATAMTYREILEANGHKVFVTHDGKSELETFEKELNKDLTKKTPFDLIISDNSMPEMNGVDAGKIIHSFFPDQKFFFITSEKRLVLDAFDVDGKNIDVEQKPISTELFIKKVAEITQQ